MKGASPILCSSQMLYHSWDYRHNNRYHNNKVKYIEAVSEKGVFVADKAKSNDSDDTF